MLGLEYGLKNYNLLVQATNNLLKFSIKTNACDWIRRQTK